MCNENISVDRETTVYVVLDHTLFSCFSVQTSIDNE